MKHLVIHRRERKGLPLNGKCLVGAQKNKGDLFLLPTSLSSVNNDALTSKERIINSMTEVLRCTKCSEILPDLTLGGIMICDKCWGLDDPKSGAVGCSEGPQRSKDQGQAAERSECFIPSARSGGRNKELQR